MTGPGKPGIAVSQCAASKPVDRRGKGFDSAQCTQGLKMATTAVPAPLTVAQAEQAYNNMPSLDNYTAWQKAREARDQAALRSDLQNLHDDAVQLGFSVVNDFTVIGDYWHADNGYYVPMPAKPSADQLSRKVTLYSYNPTLSK